MLLSNYREEQVLGTKPFEIKSTLIVGNILRNPLFSSSYAHKS